MIPRLRASLTLGCLLCLARLGAAQYADMADTNYYDQYEVYTGKPGFRYLPCQQSAQAAGPPGFQHHLESKCNHDISPLFMADRLLRLQPGTTTMCTAMKVRRACTSTSTLESMTMCIRYVCGLSWQASSHPKTLNAKPDDLTQVQQDYFFNDAESERADCRISADGSPKFNGEHGCRLLCSPTPGQHMRLCRTVTLNPKSVQGPCQPAT